MKLFITQPQLKKYVTKEVIKLTDNYLNIQRYYIFDYPFFIVTKKKLLKGTELI